MESDPWGADTARSSNAAFQPRRFTSYERDANGSDDAMMRRYSRAQARFEQADPYDGSYDLADPQSFNRYAYVQNDPVNFIDPTGLMPQVCYDIHVGEGATQRVCFGDIAPIDWYEPKEPNAGVPQGPVVTDPGTPPPNIFACDLKLAMIFGGPGSVASTSIEPPGIDPSRAGDNRVDHLANNGVLHIYGNAQGTATEVGLYRPPDGTFIRKGSGEYEEKYEDGTGTGNYSNVFQFKYPGDLVIKFFHVGGTSGGKAGGARLSSYPGQTNAAGSVRIGNIGGLGGEGNRYYHSHLEFRINGKRTDPRKILCGEYGY
ncbi:MAG: hypothetical protein M3416_01575 [Acidobacteriota bacterium]|nr:hypothetical protein [Acidobacteriota bacterium]